MFYEFTVPLILEDLNPFNVELYFWNRGPNNIHSTEYTKSL
jgi:hypothetical protein